ncbi:MAG: aliphatic sulfonate ABC transporter substrate-binding protein [Geminicoccaceae bacterium]|nr:MAG: aliphatic sulfonate ABC transporter substrate-binding protein [Geminicoccaceae bacterium]
MPDYLVNRRRALALGAAFCLVPTLARADAPSRLTLDYAYYNPLSLLLREKGWVEEALAEQGTDVRWVLSLGSNRALEFLAGGSIDLGSTAGGAALVGRANGNPIRSIYLYSRPEWTALVTRPDTGIASVADLKGKTIAVTRGTDPHLFLLQALAAHGLSERDVRTVLLQHPDGGRALVSRQVDAWAGLDPHMAQHELRDGVILFHRAPELNTYGVLNVREAFAARHPATVRRVLEAYERARVHARANPDELADILARAARLDPDVARLQLEARTDLEVAAIDAPVQATLLAAGQVLQEIGVIRPEVDVPALLVGLVDTTFTDQLATAG